MSISWAGKERLLRLARNRPCLVGFEGGLHAATTAVIGVQNGKHAVGVSDGVMGGQMSELGQQLMGRGGNQDSVHPGAILLACSNRQLAGGLMIGVGLADPADLP